VGLSALAALLAAPSPAHGQSAVKLEAVTVEATAVEGDETGASLGGVVAEPRVEGGGRAPSVTMDTAHLLTRIPGVGVSEAGAISGLPSIQGFTDDRLRVEVDGVDLVPACPNHMNPPLSYMDPARVARVTVFRGVTPVSVGGDSLGGTIVVRSADPLFASRPDALVARASIGSSYRSNGAGARFFSGATAATDVVSVTFDQSIARSDNYHAGQAFKPAAPGREGGPLLPGGEVGSSAYRGGPSRALTVAARHGDHTLTFAVSQQIVLREGYPNQRMDMTGNRNEVLGARYVGKYAWGDLEVRASHQQTDHEMDMGPDRYAYGTGMPMLTRAKNRAASVQANVLASMRDTVRLGADARYYTLFDEWPAVGGVMGPRSFWNIDFGERAQGSGFVEWEARWSPAWVTQIGVRGGAVRTNAGPVRGYDPTLRATYGDDAARFNAADRARVDPHLDLTAMARYDWGSSGGVELGYARKTRSPSLYQRYAWSTNPMAALMNNTVGDGNGYVGDVGLSPEIANTASVSAEARDARSKRWSARVTAHASYVQGYIDARRCDFGQCGAANVTASGAFVLLQYVNQTAVLGGGDASATAVVWRSASAGELAATALIGLVRGQNLVTSDTLYGMTPPNAKIDLTYRWAGVTATAEAVVSGAKRAVADVRSEIPTSAYGLLNLRASHASKFARVDVEIENLFDQLYAPPLGGAYVGQGPSMSTATIPWGVPVPGRGRSLHVGVSFHL
jgi:iron complex outermembrane receptor protein